MNSEQLPKISVITPSYNQGEFIERTILSILDQNYPNLEYIVIDGGSTDSTIDILKKYDDRIIWKSEKDKGPPDAINKGLRMSTGEILTQISADDVHCPGTLSKVMSCFAANPEIMWLFGKCKIINDNDGETNRLITAYKNFWLRRYSYNTLLILNYISSPATFWRREVSEKIGLFSADEGYAVDYEYALRLGAMWQPFILDDYLVAFRVHHCSKGSSMIVSQFKDELRIAKKYTGNKKGLIFLHYLNYLSIILGYGIMRRLKYRP